MFCSKCAAKIPDGSLFCPECGQKLAAEQPAGQQPQAGQLPLYAQPQVRQQSPYPPTRASQPAQPAYDSLSAPLSVGSFFWMPLIVAIPIVGFILLLVWAFSKDTNINRRNYARSLLIWLLVSLVLTVVTALLGGGLLAAVRNALSSM